MAAAEFSRAVPLTCHGHSRPITHLNFSSTVEEDQYYLISAAKDNSPQLRDGITGDWIGTFIGHKGAVWSSKLSSDASIAATGSADFTARIWDPQTGECLNILSHNHIVKAVSFPIQNQPKLVATGGQEKKLRIWDLTRSTPPTTDSNGIIVPDTLSDALEIGPGDHTASIKSIVWNVDYNVVTTAADDRTIRWYDLRVSRAIDSYKTDADITSCELSTNKAGASSAGVLSVAAGESAIFFDAQSRQVLKKVDFDHPIASVGINPESGRFVTGGSKDTWVRIWDFEPERLLDTLKGHHGPIWTTSFSPDGNIFATGSEDGTIKLWKACSAQYGLWR